MAKQLKDKEYKALPYRPCVGMVVLNREGQIFAGQRIDGFPDAWQMPQGGIDPDEAPRDAAFRELHEETGIPTDKVEILRESAEWLSYDLPRHLVTKLWGGQYRGQKQRWVAMRFTGEDRDVDITVHKPEFRIWTWMEHAELIERIVSFKRDTYQKVFEEFSDLL